MDDVIENLFSGFVLFNMVRDFENVCEFFSD